MRKSIASLPLLAALAMPALAEEGELVPEIHFLSWPAATYQHFAETANYVAEEWEKLGLRVNMDPQATPSPQLHMWFNEHKFDAVLSNLSGVPYRYDPDFFANAQFHSGNMAPGNWNVGEYSNPEFDRLGDLQATLYDPEERRKVVYELQRLIVEEQPDAVVYAPVSAFAINKDNMEYVGGYVDGPQGIRSNSNQVRMRSKRDQNLIRVGWTVEAATLNPLVARGLEETELAALIYDRLFWIASDGSPAPRMGRSIESIDDTTLEVKIRTDHTFSDGKPVTAEDVKFSFDYMKEWEAGYFKQHLERVESVEVVDPETVRFKLTEPYAPFVITTLGQMYVLPKHVWEPLVEEHGLENPQQYANENPIGSGPYKVKYRREGQELYLERREDHFDAPLSDIIYIIYGSAEIITQALKTGQIDAAFQPVLPTNVEDMRQEPSIEVYEAKSNGVVSVRYKTTGPVFWNRDLRRALYHAIPYERILDEILGGMGVLTSTPITPVNAFWHDPSLPTPKHDLEEARRILTEAGFTWDSNGFLRFPPKQ